MERWANKVAVVTGASSGIGAATARLLVENGMQVVGVARRLDRLTELGQSLEGQKGQLHCLQADVTVEEDVDRVFGWIKQHLGAVSLLVNNAGIVRSVNLYDGPSEDIRRTIETNLMASFVWSREAVRSMREGGLQHGHLVFVNSVVGHKVLNVPQMNIYPATKHALTAMVEQLRYELIALEPAIRTTSISPGLVKTEIFPTDKPELMAMLETLPMLQPADVANAVLYAVAAPPHVQVNEVILRPTGDVH